jgi:hypothetical protein
MNDVQHLKERWFEAERVVVDLQEQLKAAKKVSRKAWNDVMEATRLSLRGEDKP